MSGVKRLELVCIMKAEKLASDIWWVLSAPNIIDVRSIGAATCSVEVRVGWKKVKRNCPSRLNRVYDGVNGNEDGVRYCFRAMKQEVRS